MKSNSIMDVHQARDGKYVYWCMSTAHLLNVLGVLIAAAQSYKTAPEFSAFQQALIQMPEHDAKDSARVVLENMAIATPILAALSFRSVVRPIDGIPTAVWTMQAKSRVKRRDNIFDVYDIGSEIVVTVKSVQREIFDLIEAVSFMEMLGLNQNEVEVGELPAPRVGYNRAEGAAFDALYLDDQVPF